MDDPQRPSLGRRAAPAVIGALGLALAACGAGDASLEGGVTAFGMTGDASLGGGVTPIGVIGCTRIGDSVVTSACRDATKSPPAPSATTTATAAMIGVVLEAARAWS